MKKKRSADSFTLIEMLVVIVIICVLAGMVFKMLSMAQGYRDRASCMALLERIGFALNEYRAEYGTYPQVAPGACANWNNKFLVDVAGGVSCHPTDCRTCYHCPTNDPNDTGGSIIKNDTNSIKYVGLGLLYYLTSPREDETNLVVAIAETPDETKIKGRWQEFLSGIVFARAALDPGGATVGSSSFAVGDEFRTFRDPWGNSIRYKSDPPYTSYDLWSPGPDKLDGDGTPYSGSANNAKDNIHFKNGKWDG